MIKLFRKIRQNLLSEGKTGKYMKYAIGEIVLVVIGILIALSINNWNEKRKNNNLEKTFIKNLIIDLNNDLIHIDEVFDFNQPKLLYFDSLITFSRKNINTLPDHNDIYHFVYKCISGYLPFQNHNRSLSVISNLDHGVIRQNVADSIATFKQRILEIQIQSNAYQKIIQDTNIKTSKLFDMTIRYDSSYFDKKTKRPTGKLFPRINSDQALQQEFFNYVARAFGITRYYLSEEHLLGHQQKTVNFIRFLETEYKINP